MSDSLIHQLNSPAQIQMLHKKLSLVTSVLLIIVIAWTLAEITWLFFPEDELERSTQFSAKPVKNDNQQQQKFRRLAASSLFGTSVAPVAQMTKKAPVTKLNLTLKGVLAANPQTLASCIISQGKSGKEEIYGIGDKLKGGVTIKAIHPDHVVLERRGRAEILKLQQQSGLRSGAISRTKKQNNLRSISNLSPAQALAEIRRNILKSPASFGDYALPILIKEKGKQIGYRLQPQSKGKLLADLGLQPNDVITEINGIKLDKPQNGLAALRKLSSAKTVILMIKRDGGSIPLSIQLK